MKGVEMRYKGYIEKIGYMFNWIFRKRGERMGQSRYVVGDRFVLLG